jgi:hypothetical protein
MSGRTSPTVRARLSDLNESGSILRNGVVRSPTPSVTTQGTRVQLTTSHAPEFRITFNTTKVPYRVWGFMARGREHGTVGDDNRAVCDVAYDAEADEYTVTCAAHPWFWCKVGL